MKRTAQRVSRWLHASAFAIAMLSATAQAAPNRTVAIGGDVTEIIAALGQTRQLVGRDDTGTYPAEIAALPSVGYMRQLTLEGMLSLHPRILLVSEAAQPTEVIDQLTGSGLRVVRIPARHDLPSIVRKVELIAEALGDQAQGRTLAARLKAQIQQVEALPKLSVRPLYLMSHGGGAPMVAGHGTAAEAALTLAGVNTNALPDINGYRRLGSESLSTLNPSVIIVPTATLKTMGGAAELWAIPGMNTTEAGRHQRLVVVDEQALLGFGERTPAALLTLHADLVHQAAP
ncbi:heme/hemin ABC transporter substrate-binding protein [Zymobacter palmae]|uniref:ABC-type hemin transport system, periplasmic n=1 Tax=Zymobacter palmae TaxID=33074 RepID=A0A348HFR2_9GAMM|nr:ABC transporter substrate-binding protein [Zymobacter palmae]BBG30464.1 ABC-type hemin transport system, periplasmic [Zymobacter palmae]